MIKEETQTDSVETGIFLLRSVNYELLASAPLHSEVQIIHQNIGLEQFDICLLSLLIYFAVEKCPTAVAECEGHFSYLKS